MNPDSIQARTTARGIRFVQHGTVLSEVFRKPGPTHSVADVLAAAMDLLAPEPEVALLGFSGGGLLAPLRALHASHRVTAVDIDDHGFAAFESLCRCWADPVRLQQAEAGNWLRGNRNRYGLIVVDLSVELEGDVHTPETVWNELPWLCQKRLRTEGAVLFNLLRPWGGTWKEGIARVVRPFPKAHIVHFQEFENRLVLAGNLQWSARTTGLELRKRLRQLRSRQAKRLSVRNYPLSGSFPALSRILSNDSSNA